MYFTKRVTFRRYTKLAFYHIYNFIDVYLLKKGLYKIKVSGLVDLHSLIIQ